MNRTLSGVALTALYLVAVGAWCFWQWPTLVGSDASALGTFLGGVFSPLAFLWLVLGYLQQGEELRQNTRALELQAEELKNSVRHQSELVDVTRSQLQADIDRVQQEQERQLQAAKPKLRFVSGGGMSSGARVEARLIGHNVGNTAVDVSIAFEPPLDSFSPKSVSTWSRGEKINFAWSLPATGVPEATTMTISFVDAAGIAGVACFRLSPLGGSTTTWQASEMSSGSPVDVTPH